jgi:hypothetical protein
MCATSIVVIVASSSFAENISEKQNPPDKAGKDEDSYGHKDSDGQIAEGLEIDDVAILIH